MPKILPCIAVVDDEESVRRAFKRLLHSADINVVTFPSGAEFLDAARLLPFDCVILDQHMPEMGGFDVQARLMRLRKWLPVIIVTGYDTPDSRARALAAGATAYLTKPVDDQLLLDAISEATGWA